MTVCDSSAWRGNRGWWDVSGFFSGRTRLTHMFDDFFVGALKGLLFEKKIPETFSVFFCVTNFLAAE